MTKFIVTITESAQMKTQLRSTKIKTSAPTFEDVLINMVLLYGLEKEDIVSILQEEEI